MSVVSVAVFAIFRLKSMGRIGIARVVASTLDLPLPVSVSVQWALSALPVPVRVSAAYRAIGNAPTSTDAPAPNPPGAWKEYLVPMDTTNFCKDHMVPAGFWSGQRFPPKVFHRQGNLHLNQTKHRNRNQYPRRCRRSRASPNSAANRARGTESIVMSTNKWG